MAPMVCNSREVSIERCNNIRFIIFIKALLYSSSAIGLQLFQNVTLSWKSAEIREKI